MWKNAKASSSFQLSEANFDNIFSRNKNEQNITIINQQNLSDQVNEKKVAYQHNQNVPDPENRSCVINQSVNFISFDSPKKDRNNIVTSNSMHNNAANENNDKLSKTI